MATQAIWHRPPMANPRYTHVAIALHWMIAVAILYNLASGLAGALLPRGFFVFHISSGITILALSVVRVAWRLTHRPPPMLPMAAWEKGLAHTIHFLLYAAMLALPLSGWALVSANPPIGSPGAAFAEAQRAASQPVQPVVAATGQVQHVPGGRAGEGQGGGQPPRRKRGPTMVWGLFALPLIAPINAIGQTPEGVPQQRALHERIEGLHLLGGWLLLALFVLHVAGALKHQYVDRERELARMGIGDPEPAGTI